MKETKKPKATPIYIEQETRKLPNLESQAEGNNGQQSWTISYK